MGENYDRDAMPEHMYSTADDAATAWNRRAPCQSEVTKDHSDTPRTDAVAWQSAASRLNLVHADFARTLERELTEVLRSLRREENARKVLADENTRLREKLRLSDEVIDRQTRLLNGGKVPTRELL
jgi:hypothetical protein